MASEQNATAAALDALDQADESTFTVDADGRYHVSFKPSELLALTSGLHAERRRLMRAAMKAKDDSTQVMRALEIARIDGAMSRIRPARTAALNAMIAGPVNIDE